MFLDSQVLPYHFLTSIVDTLNANTLCCSKKRMSTMNFLFFYIKISPYNGAYTTKDGVSV